MGRSVVGRAALGAALVASSLGSVGCAPTAVGADEPSGAAKRTEAAPVVRTVAPVSVAEGGAFPAHLYVERDVAITAGSSGRIEQLLVDRGQRVKAGQALAVVETDLASAELRMAEQELRYREAEFVRASTLHDERIVSSEERLRKEIERDMTATEVELARARLERCTIRAPFDGIIVDRLAVVGRRVEAEDGTELFRIVAADPLRARAYVPESAVASIRVGERATVQVAGDRTDRSARVVFVGPAVDPASGTAPVIVELASRDGLKIGAAATVRFDDVPSVAVFRLPRETVREGAPEAGSALTLFVAEAGRVELRTVELVETDGGDVLVRGDVAEVDRVILAPAHDLAAGQPVDAREEQRR